MSQRQKKIGVGAVVVILLLAFSGWLLRDYMETHAPKPAPVAAEAGIVNLKDVMEAHPDYDRLIALEQERKTMILDLRDLAQGLPGENDAADETDEMTVNPPVVDSKPFDDSVWQKNAQTVIGGAIRPQRGGRQEGASYEAATKADYEAQKKAIDDEYLNEILNINLRLDNEKAMYAPTTPKDVIEKNRQELLDQLEALKQERGARQAELYRQWQAEIQSHVNEVMKPKIAAWKENAGKVKAQQQAEALNKQTAAQARDAAAMSAALQQQAMQQSLEQRREVKKREIELKTQEILNLENHILNDIAGEAEKVAINHHFTLILATPSQNLATFFPRDLQLTVPQKYYTVIGVSTEDVTDELVTAMGELSASADIDNETTSGDVNTVSGNPR